MLSFKSSILSASLAGAFAMFGVASSANAEGNSAEAIESSGSDSDQDQSKKRNKRGKKGKKARHRDGQRKNKGKKGGKLCRVLECTDDQKAVLKNARSELKNSREAKKGQAKSVRQELAAEYRKANPDQGKIQSLISKLGDLREERMQAKAKMFADLHASLNADQRDKLADHIAKKGFVRGGKGHHKARRGGKHKRAQSPDSE